MKCNSKQISVNQVNVALFFFRLSTSGGAERMICWLANALVERGFDVTIFSLDEPGVKSFYELKSSVNWVQLGLRSGLMDKLRRVKSLFTQLRKRKIDLLIGFVISGDKTIYAATKLARVKLIVAERNAPSMYYIRYSSQQRMIIFYLMKYADYITVQCERFVDNYPANLQRKINVIPNPVKSCSNHAFPDVLGNKYRFVMLAVSRLDEVQKALTCLIEAFALVQSDFPLWDLHIVGGGPDEAAYNELIQKKHLQSRIKLLKESKNITSCYVRSHLFVMPSRWEGFPNALAEAMAAGLPVIGFSEAEGVSDLISEDVGWLAEGISDSVSLSKTLKIAMNSHDERKAKGLQAIKAMDNYAEEIQIEKWIKLINRVRNE